MNKKENMPKMFDIGIAIRIQYNGVQMFNKIESCVRYLT